LKISRYQTRGSEWHEAGDGPGPGGHRAAGVGRLRTWPIGWTPCTATRPRAWRASPRGRRRPATWIWRAYATLMPFRWAKLKETSLDVGLDSSLAGRLEQARARVHLEVVTGIDRPPDTPAVPGDACPPAAPMASTSPPSPPEPAKPRLDPRPAIAPAPPSYGQPVPSHVYWTRQPEPEPPQTDYDPWEKG
jgi:hypothetical protein